METFLELPYQNPTHQDAELGGRTQNESLHWKIKNLCTVKIWLRQATSTLRAPNLLFTYFSSLLFSGEFLPSLSWTAGTIKTSTMAYIQLDRAIGSKKTFA